MPGPGGVRGCGAAGVGWVSGWAPAASIECGDTLKRLLNPSALTHKRAHMANNVEHIQEPKRMCAQQRGRINLLLFCGVRTAHLKRTHNS